MQYPFQFCSIQFIAMRWLSTCLEKGCFIEPRQDFSLKSSSNLKTSDQSSKFLSSEVIDENIDNDDGKKVDKNMKQGFVCAHSSNESHKKQSHNELITQELSKLASTYKNSNDQWRSYAYEKAIAAIKRHPAPISTREGMSVHFQYYLYRVRVGFKLQVKE